MAIKYEDGVGGTSTATVHGGAGVPLSYVPFVDPNAITDPYAVQPPLPAGSTTHINNPAPITAPVKPLPTVVKVPGSGDTVATSVKPVILQGEPAPVYEPTMSPSETAEQNLANAPVAQPDVIPTNVVADAGLTAPKQPTTGKGTKTTSTGGGGTGVVSGGTATAPTAQATQPWKEYMDKAINTTFSYDPSTDNEYKLASAQVEQQVTDMMVGRGGLYSSVAQSALTNKLMELQVAYQKQAYDKFLTERDYNMKIASFMADRSDTEFEQNLSLEKFKADMEQQKFQNSITSANLRIAQANAAYNRQVAQAKQQQASAQTALNMQTTEYMASSKEFEYMQNKWREEGAADYEIASYFNVPIGADVSSQFGNRITQALYNLDSKAATLAQQAKSIGDADTYLQALTGFQTETVADPKTIQANYNTNYSSVYNSAVNSYNAGKTWLEIYNSAIGNSALLDDLGTDNYNKLMSVLATNVSKE